MGEEADGPGVTVPPVSPVGAGAGSGARRRGGLSSITHAKSEAESANADTPANTDEDSHEEDVGWRRRKDFVDDIFVTSCPVRERPSEWQDEEPREPTNE